MRFPSVSRRPSKPPRLRGGRRDYLSGGRLCSVILWTQTLNLGVQTHQETQLPPPPRAAVPASVTGPRPQPSWEALPMLVPVLPFGVTSQPGGPTRLQSLSRPRLAAGLLPGFASR